MPYDVRIHNYHDSPHGGGPGGNYRNERTPLIVGSSGASTGDGTFSTITLDSTLVANSRNRSTGSGYHHRHHLEEDEPPQNLPEAPSRLRLSLLISLALIMAAIQYQYELWWGVAWNALLIATGTASLVACCGNHHCCTKGIHTVSLWVWAASALGAVVLFVIVVVWQGPQHLLWWCLVYANGRYSDSDVTYGVCATLSDDGTLEMVWIVEVVLGVVLGFPFLIHAVRTVYLFYAAAAAAAAASTNLT